MSHTTTQMSLLVSTDISRETILDEVEALLSPLAEMVAETNQAEAEGKPLPHEDVEGVWDLAEELDDITEADDVMDVFTNTISFRRTREPGSCVELRCGTDSLSTEAFEALAPRLASLSNKPYAKGFFACDDSRDGMFCSEFVVTKDGTTHTLTELAEATLAAL